MWAKEKEVQKETIKDLPKMNQVGPIRTHNRCFWKILTEAEPSHPAPHHHPSTPWNVGILLPTFRTSSQAAVRDYSRRTRGQLLQGLVQNTPLVMTCFGLIGIREPEEHWGRFASKGRDSHHHL